MADIYNDIVDLVGNLVGKLTTSEIYKKTKESFSKSEEIKGIVKEIEKSSILKPYVDIIKKASNRKVVNLEYGGKLYALDYEKRKWIVYYIVGGLLLNHILKMNYLRKLVINYIFFSAILCRENFDLNNYRIQKSNNKNL